jgi:hypothetical protein
LPLNEAHYEKLRRILLDEYAMVDSLKGYEKDETKETESVFDLLRGIFIVNTTIMIYD